MDAAPLDASPSAEQMFVDIQTATQFLCALFEEEDLILFRPIETWIEDGQKKSRVDFGDTRYRKAKAQQLQTTLLLLLRLAARDHLNLFFGVCPRPGDKGRFDLAWQIRTVRTLWVDVDHVSVGEARERVDKAGLPQPSVVVNSGNGAHVYWLLDPPYLIDDADDPPAVETEWLVAPNGRKKPRKYIFEGDDRVYLDERRHVWRLSPKAQHAQDILAGIANACGGDHTTDLARLLRLPGTLNRKDERNGKEPIPTALVECDVSRRYAIAAFESLATPSDETQLSRQIAEMRLPRPRKLAASKADRLDELISASSIALPGKRSEADFALCCYAVRNGAAKEDVWAQVEHVGKFAEQGRRYFDITWESAEYETRVAMHRKLTKSTRHKTSEDTNAGDDGSDSESERRADDPNDPEGNGEPPTIRIDSELVPVSVTMAQITDRLLNAGNCFNRADQLVVVRDQTVSPILSAKELAGLLNHYVEFFFIEDEEGGQYKPLPTNYGNTWLNHPGERARLPTVKLFTRNPVYTEDWRLVSPGYDQASGIYYAGPLVELREGTEHLEALLADFCFKSIADRTNYVGMLLTTLLVPLFVGSKPAVLFNGNQPELGKSILAQIIAIMRDGRPVETASYNPNDEEFEKRLGSIVRRGVTTIIVDNAKGCGRSARIESACLERSITDPILSFRLLGHSQDIRAENSHIFCITANTPDVSRDLVTRSVVVNLYHEGDPESRTFSIADPEGYAQEHRLELLGELIGMIERWKAAGMRQARVNSRFNKRGWGSIVGGILEECGEPDFLANAAEAATQLDDTRREFSELVGILADHPQGVWTAAELTELAGKHGLLKFQLGEGSPRSQSSRLGLIAGRYVAERFDLPDGRTATFHRTDGRKGNLYAVDVTEDVPNV